MLAVDCHPWHGHLGLVVLKTSEIEKNPRLDDPGEMATWDLFDLSKGLPSHEELKLLGKEMALSYRAAESPSKVADNYMRMCSAAMKTDLVGSKLTNFTLAPTFRLSVAHPDDGREFINCAYPVSP